ncbi:MAG: hypothetical protein ACXVJ7_10765 [Acidimicrobiia bacterium]
MTFPLLGAYGLGLIGVVWFAVDSSRIPGLVWFWSGYSRAGWWTTVVVAFVALGVPAFIAAVAWRFSAARKGLYHEVDELRGGAARRQERIDRSTRSIT